MQDAARGVFNELVERLKADESVVGFFLSGSRGKGFGTDDSDYDLVVIAADGAGTVVRERYPFRYHPKVDCVVYTLAEFRSYAAFGSPSAWDRYSFAHVSVQWDRSGELQRLVDEKGRLPESERAEFLHEALDSHINSTYRSLKRTAKGDRFGARLEAAQSIRHLLDVVFGLEGRHAPFPGYLELELEKYPLVRLPVSPSRLLDLIESGLAADVDAQQETLRLLEPICRDRGLGDVIDAWTYDYSWMLSFKGAARDTQLSRADGIEPEAEYVIAILLPFPVNHWVEVLRDRYDPLAKELRAHITLVHPFPSRMNCDDLQRHMSEVAASFTSFRVELHGITGHQDEYLFLNLVRGNDEVVTLRERLYRGELAGHRDQTRSFLPHVTVGRLSDQSQFLEALRSTHSCAQMATEVVEEIVSYRIETDGRRPSTLTCPLFDGSRCGRVTTTRFGSVLAIFLFDEPASNLHQTAQQRLLKALNQLTRPGGVSVIYTTHSHHLIDPLRLESTFIVKNMALDATGLNDDFTASMTDIAITPYREFVARYPDQRNYFQPILDVLEYRPGSLENVPNVVMTEGKTDFYLLSLLERMLGVSPQLNFLPGGGAGGLDTPIQLYVAWGRPFLLLLDGDAEGQKQKRRYTAKYGSVLNGRILTLDNVEKDWRGNRIEDLLDKTEQLKLQQVTFPDSKRVTKKRFHLAVQEALAGEVTPVLGEETTSNFKQLLDRLSKELGS